jgi:hypothetical protein
MENKEKRISYLFYIRSAFICVNPPPIPKVSGD